MEKARKGNPPRDEEPLLKKKKKKIDALDVIANLFDGIGWSVDYRDDDPEATLPPSGGRGTSAFTALM